MTSDATEDLEHFRHRARTWIRANLREVGPMLITVLVPKEDGEERAAVARAREVQRMLFDAGLAGLCVPRAYGGQGLTAEHQKAFNEELAGFEYPALLQVPTMNPCLAVLLDHGTEEQKRRHVPAILRGDEIWVQLLSEPTAGSDLAGSLTTAERDGEEWVLNGSKVWTTGAWWADWGLCLARTNWDVPKHRGLSVFMVPLTADGIEIHRIEMLNGNREFCQEFLVDVRVPDADRVGEIDEGWTVATRWMFHERMLYNSPYVTMPAGTQRGETAYSLVDIARDAGLLDDPTTRDLIGEARALALTGKALKRRVLDGISSGAMSEHGAAVARLFTGTVESRSATIAMEVGGEGAAAWTDDDGEVSWSGTAFLMRQTNSIGGGTTEMARNIIAERLLGMPRERSVDRDLPFRDVPRARPSGH